MLINSEIRAQILLATAAHEAGHAVARWYLDRTSFMGRYYVFPWLRHVAISLNGEVLLSGRGDEMPGNVGVCAGDPCIMPFGALTFDASVTPEMRRRFAKHARRAATADCVHTMAGPIAEALHREDEWPIEDAFGWLHRQEDEASMSDAGEKGTDYWQVDKRIPLLGRRWRLHLDRAFQLADRIVRDHQPHIKVLAAALVTRGMIEGEEVERLFDGIATGRA